MLRWVPALLVVSLVGATRAATPTTLTGKDGAVMVLVGGGPFAMGSGGGRDDETPPHRCDLPPFYIDRCEVTNAQYARFVQATGASPPVSWNGSVPPAGRERFPVTNVTWFDAMRYAVWAGKRLPTEAEWEKAARGTDGRLYPWGNEDDKARRNVGSDNKLEPVGQRAAGASPYGCLDMSGNAWEWTADWYDGYPGTSARSVQFGRQYKVMRGGGAIYFYGIDNTGSCTQRTRLVPYGDHDSLGFRCVKDVDASKAPYDAAKLLAEAEALLKASLREPVTLSYETEYAGYLKAGRIPLQVVGTTGQSGPVRVGVPLPEGVVKNSAQLRLIGPDGRDHPAQTTLLASWRDGSARWALLDFDGQVGKTYEVDYRGSNRAVAFNSVDVARTAEVVTIGTGAARIVVAREGLLKEIQYAGAVSFLRPMQLGLTTVTEGGPVELVAQPAEKVEVEDSGPMHACARLRGAFAAANGTSSPFRYDLCVHAYANSTRLSLLLTITHFAKRAQPEEKAAPVVNVANASIRFALASSPAQVLFGTDRGEQLVEPGKRLELLQLDDLQYTILRDGQKVAAGTRAPGWAAVRQANGWLTLGTRHFWQSHPKSLFVTPDAVGIRLWAGQAPFEWEAGLAKTHEVVLDFSREQPGCVCLDPLRAIVPPAWACGTDGVGPTLPRGIESMRQFPYWELLRESSKRRWVCGMPTGFRDFGDAYMGGPYKGKNAYNNLEYDVHFNFLLEFLRTGHLWYFDAAEVQARHQADIDIDHFEGRPWKHSPQHTTTTADFGHVFVRGLILHYLVTGEKRSLEAAREIGDYLAPRVEKLQGIGNERQIGWSLYALSALYEFTGDERYLKAAATACAKLASGQSATGRFNIRWDNRISFFNGIAMNGMLSVYQFTQDEQVARTILQVAQRTLGFYPEYACRTLDAFCWAAQRTKDPRYLDNLERTWQTSMEWLMGRDSGVVEETHAWHFTRLAAKYRLFPLFEREPAVLPNPATWQGIRLDQPSAELFLRTRTARPAPIMIVLEGTADGTVELLDAAGKTVQVFELRNSRRFFQAAAFTVPAGRGFHRLRLNAQNSNAWQVHQDGDSQVTVYDPRSAHLGNLYPRAMGFLKDGTKEVVVRFEAMGEGFHSATLYDPDSNPVASVRRFVDFQDPNRYEVELKASINDPRTDGWGLELYNLKVLSTDGLQPYWASDGGNLFNPERAGK